MQIDNKQTEKSFVRSSIKPERIAEVENFFKMVEAFPHLCTSCGMCAGICPTDAILMKTNEFAQYVPEFIQSKCVYCRKCIVCCPGIDVSGSAEGLGPYQELYLAFAINDRERESGSSGGVITALSNWMLAEGLIEKAIMLNTQHSAITPEIVINTTQEQVENSSGSKYVIAPICTAISSFDSQALITVLPCQSIAMARMHKQQGYIFGLFCSGAQTRHLIDFISGKENFQVDDIEKIAFRDGNWPGNVTIQTVQGKINIPYNRSYFTAATNGGYFTIQGCATCPDYFNEKADISFGDPWGLTRDFEVLLGKTLVIARTDKGVELLHKAKAQGIIQLEPITEKHVLNGHRKSIYFKKKMLFYRIKKLKGMGLPLPKHSEDLTQQYNFVDAVVNNFYMHNMFTLKKRYERLFTYSKARIFLERFTIHAIHTLYLRLQRMVQNYFNKNGAE